MISGTRLISVSASVLTLAGMLTAAASVSAMADRAPWVLVPDNATVWQVSGNGAIVRLPHSFMSMKEDSGMHFSVFPELSPDQKRIAFVQDNDLWIYEVAKRKATKLTSVGRPQDEQYASVFVSISTWSPDSRKILYRVLGGPTEPQGDAIGPKVKERPGPYGTYVYDLDQGTSDSLVVSSGNLEPVWLPNGQFLVIHGGPTSSQLDNELHRYDPATRRSTPVTTQTAWYGRPVLSPDGRWIVVHAGQKPEGTLRSQLWRIDLTSGEVTRVTPLGRWGEYQRPALSPGQGRLAYHWQQTYDRHSKKGIVVANGRELYPHEGIARVFWIDDDTIAVLARKELVVIDVNSGQIRGRQVR